MDDYTTTDMGTGIYGYLNLETNEIDYVGQTSRSFQQRDREHRRKKNENIHFDYKLQAHPDKYIMIPLTYCDDIDSLDLLETFYIYYFNTIDKDNYTWYGSILRGKWHPNFRDDLDDKEIRKLYIKEGLSTAQISERLGTNDVTISNRLKKQGVKVQDKRIRDDLDDEEIKKLYIEEGLSTIQIGKKFGTSSQTINKRLRKQGIKVQDKKIRDDLDAEEIRKLYVEEGLTIIEISEKLRTSKSTISRRLKKQGVKVQDKRIHDDLDVEEIKKLYIEEGLSTVQIGKRLGVHHSTINMRLKNQGIKVSKNTSNYYRVSKAKNKGPKQGFTWVYTYPENNKQKTISSVDFKTLKKKVQAKGLPWYKINDR